MDGTVSSVSQFVGDFLINEWENVMMLTGAVSLETVLLGTQENCLNGWI